MSYWNGDGWVPVGHQQITYATASNAPATIAFDPVSTTKLKLDMTSATPANATTGNITIAELQAPRTWSRSTRRRAELARGRRPRRAGLRPGDAQLHQRRCRPGRPQITATAAANGTVTINAPLSVPGTATVTVTSEDGSASTTYTLALVPSSTSTTGTVGGTRAGDAVAHAWRTGVVRRVHAGRGKDVHGVAPRRRRLDSRRRRAERVRPGQRHPGHLVNGPFTLPQALQAHAGSPAGTSSGPLTALGASPLALLTYTGPVSNDPVAIDFKQSIGANDPLRTGSYSKTLTFTLSTTSRDGRPAGAARAAPAGCITARAPRVHPA